MIHLISFPHTAVNKDYGQCAYTQKLVKFHKMFPECTLYANEGSNGEYVQIFSKEEQKKYYGYLGDKYYAVEWSGAGWSNFNLRVISELKTRIQPKDLILILGGVSQKVIADAFPNNLTVEFGIGYEGVFSPYRVYESYAWMHYLYGKYGMDGRFYDAVIPNYFDPADFPYSKEKEDYLLFMSRPVDRKGIEIVKEMGRRGSRIVVAGAEEVKGENISWVGYADSTKRGELMSKAKAILCPTLYIEPFGGVVVEAALCGTPSITTDWGAFIETVEQGKTGSRCRSLHEFLEASKLTYDYQYIRDRAISLYSLDAVKPQYEHYFSQLDDLWDKGWYTV